MNIIIFILYIKNTLSSYTFYSLPDDISEENKSKIRYEGIYIFGGVNEKKIYCNDLYVIKIGKKPCINIKPKITNNVISFVLDIFLKNIQIDR